MKYEVECTKILNGTYYTEASTIEEAIKKAEEAIDNGDVVFENGETTADYAVEIND